MVYWVYVSYDQPVYTFQHVQNLLNFHLLQVPDLFGTIRSTTKDLVRDGSTNHGPSHQASTEHSPTPDPIQAAHLCEVMYVGKVAVTHKKAPPTFIDEAVERFRDFEEKKKEDRAAIRRRNESGDSVRSLPSDLEKTVTIQENHLESQTSKKSSSSETFPVAAMEDDIPLGGSSSSLALKTALQQLQNTSDASNVSKPKRSPPDALQKSDPKPGGASSQSGGGDTHSEPQLLSASQDSITHSLVSQHVGQGDGHGTLNVDVHDQENLQRAAVLNQAPIARKNRTMLIQVGQNEVSLISPDRKRVIFERKFRDISFCSQVSAFFGHSLPDQLRTSVIVLSLAFIYYMH